MHRVSTLLPALGLLLLTDAAFAQGVSEPELRRQPYQSSATGKEREYLLYLPPGYHDDPNQLWPVILFLHGGGERGEGLENLKYSMIHGPLMEAWIQKRDLGFIIINPQLPVFDQEEGARNPDRPTARLESGVPPRPPERRSDRPMVREAEADQPSYGELGPPDGWWRTESDLLAMLDEVGEDFRGDPDRVYLTGLSYGGFGTFYMAAAHPERWAAIAPIVGAGDPNTATTLAEYQLPIWMFGGGRDPLVRVGWLYEMANALEAAGHESVRFTVHEDRGHNAWGRVYAGQDLYDWFLSYTRR